MATLTFRSFILEEIPGNFCAELSPKDDIELRSDFVPRGGRSSEPFAKGTRHSIAFAFAAVTFPD